MLKLWCITVHPYYGWVGNIILNHLQPRHKRAKNALPYNAESKRQRHEHVDENSVDNDPIDVNKFLANDEIRIKEEENFEDSFADYVQVILATA